MSNDLCRTFEHLLYGMAEGVEREIASQVKRAYTVIYRTGGTANFKWNRVLERFDHDAAIACRQRLERQGYPAIVHKTAMLDSIGMPETFD